MEEEIRIWRYAKNFMWTDEDNTIYFRSKRGTEDIAWFDKRSRILYENTKYKNRFKAAKREMYKKLELNKEQISEYLDIV